MYRKQSNCNGNCPDQKKATPVYSCGSIDMSSIVPNMTQQRPNLLLIMTDQQRGDCLGIDGHPCLQTPNLDSLALNGMRFTRAYSTCPVCIPARRSLLSGLFPASHGMVGYEDHQEWNPPGTLPSLLRDHGYQTCLVGRSMHQHPERKRFGYEEMITQADYSAWLRKNLAVDTMDPEDKGYFGPLYSTGIMHNDWTARSWPYDENLHFTNWTVHEARRFLLRRDPTCPFFLTVSFIHPHPPLIPPDFYFQKYDRRNDLPEAAIGDWAQPPRQQTPNASATVLWNEETRKSCLAGYFGSIQHVDDQIRRIVYELNGIPGFDPDNTVIAFTSDHGEMLGDHFFFRKSLPYEGAARIPFLFRLPASEESAPRGATCDLPVCLEDIFPTMLDVAGIPIPDWIEGQSLLPVLRGESPQSWRSHLPIEIGGTVAPFHALTDGREKYIRFSRDGREQFFDLHADPQELCNLIDSPDSRERVELWRERLIEHLTGRPEGFVKEGKWQTNRPHHTLIMKG
jgi:arylsulfatase